MLRPACQARRDDTAVSCPQGGSTRLDALGEVASGAERGHPSGEWPEGVESACACGLKGLPAVNISLDLSSKKQLDAPECAALGAFSKAGQQRGLLPARRSNAAGRVGRGAIGCLALSAKR
jgi:hypothetical protein